jgi:hypothetical protein
MPAVVLADGNQDPRRLAGLENDDDLIGFRVAEIPVDEAVAPLVGRGLEDRRLPVLGLRGDPVVVLPGDVLEDRFAHGVQLAVPAEETDDALRLLKRLNEAIQQQAIEAAVGEPDAIVVMLVEGVHEAPPRLQHPAGYLLTAATSTSTSGLVERTQGAA